MTDFDEILHSDIYWPPTGIIVRKIMIFLKIQHGGGAMLKITKIVISPQRFDQSLRNLVR